MYLYRVGFRVHCAVYPLGIHLPHWVNANWLVAQVAAAFLQWWEHCLGSPIMRWGRATSPLNEASLQLWLVGATPFQPFQLRCSKGGPTLGSKSGPSGSSSPGHRTCTSNACSTWSIQCVITEVPGVARLVIYPAMVKAPERVSRCGGHGLLLGHACFGLGSCCGCHRLHSLCHWYEDRFKPCGKEKGRGCWLLFTVASLIFYEEPMWDEKLRREIRKGIAFVTPAAQRVKKISWLKMTSKHIFIHFLCEAAGMTCALT